MIEHILSSPGIAGGLSVLVLLGTAVLSGSIALGVSELIKRVNHTAHDRPSIV